MREIVEFTPRGICFEQLTKEGKQKTAILLRKTAVFLICFYVLFSTSFNFDWHKSGRKIVEAANEVFRVGRDSENWDETKNLKEKTMQTEITKPENVEQLLRNDLNLVDTSFWNLLHEAAMAQIAQLIKAIQEIAPLPGSLVYVDAKRPSYNWNGWQPILFSSIDICTHLQIARMYLTPTQASAIDFLQFITEKYPFPLKQVRTTADPLFINPVSIQSEHQFTSEAKKLGIFHSIVLENMNHPILRVVSKYLFGGPFGGSVEETSEEKVITGLVNFLFFHNNHRSLASLGGLTPLQKLNSFEGFVEISWFDPYKPIQLRKTGNGSY